MKSFSKLVLETYKPRALEHKVVNGFATIAQKNKVVGLRLLVEFNGMVNGSYITLPKHSLVYIREEVLHSQPWVKQVLESDDIDGPFILADVSHMEFAEQFPDEGKLRSEAGK